MSNQLKRGREEAAQPDEATEGPYKRQKISENSILDYLHEELVQHILVFIPHLGSLHLVCKLFNNILHSQEYWRRKSLEEWGPDNVIPELRALSLTSSSDALLSTEEWLKSVDKLEAVLHCQLMKRDRKKFEGFAHELRLNYDEEDEPNFANVSELKTNDISDVLKRISSYTWDDDDPIMWPEGNRFQNTFARKMFDCMAELLLAYINREDWANVEYITRKIFIHFDLAGVFINHEAVCVKLLDICEALQDKATYVISYFQKVVSCFKILKRATEFTKRVYRKLIEQRIKLGLMTEYLPAHPTKHPHFRYPQKSVQSFVLTNLFPNVNEFVPILFEIVSQIYYDPKSNWRLRVSALAALRTLSTSDEHITFRLFEFALDALKSDNEELLHAGLVLLYDIAIYCGNIDDQISEEQASCLVPRVTQQIRKQPVQHGLFLMEAVVDLVYGKSQCVSDELLEELNASILWLLQQQGVINSGTVEFRTLERLYDLGAAFRSRLRPYLPKYKEVLFKMALSPDLKADLITNEEILVVYYKLLKFTVEDFQREGKALTDQVLQNSIGFEVRHPQFFALCGAMAYEHHYNHEDDRDQLTIIIKAMMAIFSEQVSVYGQSSYPDFLPQIDVPTDIPQTMEQFLLATKAVMDKKQSPEGKDLVLAEFFNFEVAPEPQEIKDTNSLYASGVNSIEAFDHEFDRAAIREELNTHFCTNALEDLVDIIMSTKEDFLPFAQTALHIALASFRLINPPKHRFLNLGISQLLKLLRAELGDYDRMQYAKIVLHRLDFMLTHFFDTVSSQGLMTSLFNLYTMCLHYQLGNPYMNPLTIKALLDYYAVNEEMSSEPHLPKLFSAMTRLAIVSSPRKTYAALENSNLKENGWLLKALDNDKNGDIFECFASLAVYFGLEYTISLLNSETPPLELVKKIRDSCLQYYLKSKATLNEGSKSILELLLVTSSAALIEPEIMEFRLFLTFTFELQIITKALKQITSDEEIKSKYGTGSQEFDEFITEAVLKQPDGFIGWFWVAALRHSSFSSVLANVEQKLHE